MPRRQKKLIPSFDRLPPPRSIKYAHSDIEMELPVSAGGIRYLMRKLSCGAVELVRYDYDAHKWIVLSFSGIEKSVKAV